MAAIFGRKIGMTQIFSENGEARGVTVIEAAENVVVQVKTTDSDGYEAIQVGFGRRKRLTAPAKGHMRELGQFARLREVRVPSAGEYQVGQKLGVDLFEAGDLIDVTSKSKGRGFAGGIKRYHFRGGPKTHGQSDRHRSPGSIGSGTTPGRVRKGLRMAGHMGDRQVTVKNLRIIEANQDRGLLLIAGAVPGGANGLVRIRQTGKRSGAKA